MGRIRHVMKEEEQNKGKIQCEMEEKKYTKYIKKRGKKGNLDLLNGIK